MENSVKLESSCTPGPWVVQGTKQGLRIFRTPDGFGNTVADVAGATEDRSWERAKANANLIAAAPDLLAALWDLCGAAGPYSKGHRSTPVDAEVLEAGLAQAFDAIAKAEKK